MLKTKLYIEPIMPEKEDCIMNEPLPIENPIENQGDQSLSEAITPEPTQPGLQAVACHDAEPERLRRWHFTPQIHIDIANRKLAVTLNTQTGFLEADQILQLTPDELFEFLDAISDQALADLRQTIETLCHFAPVQSFSISEMRFSKTGEISFDICADCVSVETKGIIPSMSFERIQFSLNREGIPQSD